MPTDPHGNRRFVLRAADIGHVADEVLAEPECWRVIAVHSRSLYAQSAAGSVICVGSRAIGVGPLTVTCALPAGTEWQHLGIKAGEAGRGVRGRLTLSPRVRVEFGSARIWTPPSFAPASRATLRRRIADVMTRVGTDSPQEGFSPLIGSLIRGAVREKGAQFAPLARALVEGGAAVDEWLGAALRGGDAEPTDSARNLIGLGIGLTPSGDDFLGGVLIALRGLDHADLANRLADWLLPGITGRTNVISAAHLTCAARGSGGAAIHAALANLGAVKGGGGAAAVDAIRDFGHTSGWDALAGMLVVLCQHAVMAE